MAHRSESASRLKGESWATSAATRASMQSNKGRDTAPELIVRRRLHASGLRYLVSVRPVPGLRRTADIVFRGPRVAVFVDGCFWHGCPSHYQAPERNAGFWLAKLGRNRERDIETVSLLEAAGWTVMRVWEREVRSSPDAVVARIERVVRGPRAVDSR